MAPLFSALAFDHEWTKRWHHTFPSADTGWSFDCWQKLCLIIGLFIPNCNRNLRQWLLNSHFDWDTKIAWEISAQRRCEISHELRILEQCTPETTLHRPSLWATTIQINPIDVRINHFSRRQIFMHCIRCKLRYQWSVVCSENGFVSYQQRFNLKID